MNMVYEGENRATPVVSLEVQVALACREATALRMQCRMVQHISKQWKPISSSERPQLLSEKDD